MPTTCAGAKNAKGGATGNDAYLVGILHENVLALWLLHEDVCNGPDDAPAVCKGDVQLVCELRGPNRGGAEDNVAGVVPRVGTRDIT